MNLAPQQLEQHLSNGLKPLYVLAGDEPLSQRECLDAIRNKARQLGFDERTSLTVDRYFNWAQITEFGQSMSLFASQRLLEIHIPNGKPGIDGSKSLQSLASEPLADTVTIVVLPKVDWRDAKRAWYLALQQTAIFIELNEVPAAQLPQWISNRLALQKQSTDPETLIFMANQVEGNLLAAHQEIQKLALLYPNGVITDEQIRAAVLKVARYDLFELTEALLSGDAARLNRMVDGLQGEGEPLPLILWGISDELRTLNRAQAALAAGESLPTIMRNYRIWGKREKLYPTALKRIQPKKLKQALLLAANLDKQAKGLWVRDLPANPWDGLRLVGSLLR